MLKCAPYIKNLCSSLQSGLWKEGSSNPNGPSSLPGSPIRRPRNEVKVQPPSPTRSEGTGVAAVSMEAEDLTDGGSLTTRGSRLHMPFFCEMRKHILDFLRKKRKVRNCEI